MTAAQARSNPALRARVAERCGCSDRAVSDYLAGWPCRARLAERLGDVLTGSGVDLATLPARTVAEVEAWRKKRAGRAGRTASDGAGESSELLALRARVAELTDLLEQRRFISRIADDLAERAPLDLRAE